MFEPMMTETDDLDGISSDCAVDAESAGNGDAVPPKGACIIDMPLSGTLRWLGMIPVRLVFAHETSSFLAGRFGGIGDDPVLLLCAVLGN